MTSPTRCSRRCASSSVATTRRSSEVSAGRAEAVGIELEVLDDQRAAAERAAELIASAGSSAARERDSFSLALSGGRSPWAMVARLGEIAEMPWAKTELFQVDERIASPGSEERN